MGSQLFCPKRNQSDSDLIFKEKNDDQILKPRKQKGIRVALVGSQGVGTSSVFSQITFKSTRLSNISSNTILEIGLIEDNIEFVSWTVSEDDEESLNEKLFIGFNGIAFVFDTTQKDSFNEQGLLMRRVISLQTMIGKPLLILLNKSDDPNGLNLWQASQRIGLEFIQDREIHIQNCSALKNEGIETGIKRLLLFIEILASKNQQK